MKKTETPVVAGKKKSARQTKAASDATITKPTTKKKVLPLYCGQKNPFTPEAWEYVNREDLWTGTDKALCFMTPSLIFQIANAQERTLDLEQVKVLVYPEGPDAEMCSLLKGKKISEEKFFTPVSYAYAISPKGLAQIEAGTPFSEVKGFFRGGPYYVNKAKTEAKAYSGSPIRFNVSKGIYFRNDGSSLVIQAEAIGSQKRPVWGVPFSEIERIIQAQSRKTELRTLASQMAGDLTNGRGDNRERGDWNRIGDHPFKRSKHENRPREKHHSAKETD